MKIKKCPGYIPVFGFFNYMFLPYLLISSFFMSVSFGASEEGRGRGLWVRNIDPSMRIGPIQDCNLVIKDLELPPLKGGEFMVSSPGLLRPLEPSGFWSGILIEVGKLEHGYRAKVDREAERLRRERSGLEVENADRVEELMQKWRQKAIDSEALEQAAKTQAEIKKDMDALEIREWDSNTQLGPKVNLSLSGAFSVFMHILTRAERLAMGEVSGGSENRDRNQGVGGSPYPALLNILDGNWIGARDTLKEKGLIPEEAWTPKIPLAQWGHHAEEITRDLNMVIKKWQGGSTWIRVKKALFPSSDFRSLVRKDLQKVLEKHLGSPPVQFNFLGKMWTPREFSDYLFAEVGFSGASETEIHLSRWNGDGLALYPNWKPMRDDSQSQEKSEQDFQVAIDRIKTSLNRGIPVPALYVHIDPLLIKPSEEGVGVDQRSKKGERLRLSYSPPASEGDPSGGLDSSARGEGTFSVRALSKEQYRGRYAMIVGYDYDGSGHLQNLIFQVLDSEGKPQQIDVDISYFRHFTFLVAPEVWRSGEDK